MKITVVGSGGWGTALALLLVENGHDVTLWSHTPAKAVALEETCLLYTSPPTWPNRNGNSCLSSPWEVRHELDSGLLSL